MGSMLLMGAGGNAPPPTITSFTPTVGVAATSIVITGTNFGGATAVAINGIAASSFVVNSPTQITAAVASSPTVTAGAVAVTTPGGTATSGASFTNLSTQCVGWFEANVGTWQNTAGTTPASADTDPVGRWDDKSGAANNVLQGTSAKKPLLKLSILNSLPVIRFDGSNDDLRLAFTLNQPHTRFAVLFHRDGQDFQHVLLDGNGGDSADLVFSAANTLSMFAGSTACSVTAANSTWYVHRATHNGASSKGQVNAGTAATGNAGASNPGGITMGSGGSNAFFCNCDLAAVLQFNAAISDAEVAVVFNYLNAKWAAY